MMAIKKFLLLVLVGGYSTVRGRAQRAPHAVKKVLVVQMAKLGDMVCTTPLFRAIKTKYPSTEVVVLGNRLNKDVVAHNPDVDEYIVFEGMRETIRRLREADCDAACLAGGPDTTSVAVTFLAGITLIVAPEIKNGYSPLYDMWYRLIARFVVTTPHTMGQYAPREYLRLLEPLGISSDDTSKHLFFSPEADATTAKFLSASGVASSDLCIGISPSAGNKIKNWGADRFAELAERLSEKYAAKIIVIGGPRDRKEVNEMLNHLPSGISVINASEKFSIDELKALVSKLNLFISVDTGPVYIAEAFNVPTIDIVGPLDEREQPPTGEKHLVVTPPGSRTSALHIMNARGYDKREARRQIDSITVDMAFDAAQRLLDTR